MDEERKPGETMLAWLKQERVFEIGAIEDKFYICELCDEWYSVRVTAADLVELADEIRALATAKTIPSQGTTPTTKD